MSTDYLDPAELQEWQDALDSIVKHRGYQQAGDMLRSVSEHAEQTGIPLPQAITHPIQKYDCRRKRAHYARRSVHGTKNSLSDSLECYGYGHARQR